MNYQVSRSDEKWREILTAPRFAVLREAATERPFTGELLAEHRPGTYHCAGCGAPLFDAETKFESHCGWPSFYKDIKPGAIEYVQDKSHGMVRTEVRCANCGSHLGHIFDDAPQTPTGQRFCINSLALEFVPADES
ncbi:peptide-methionine (R)-S-oxide reductase MsrB [Rarobacter incanus]|uniref:Peptide methionine sulfoxide reductase MsrB n=1 Tax=Rarobacter incanus TaxID=153494 RepID=A0A542SQJ6_9MICO|nr:peptide-methionine (R)-S-oxide reductase MsrB [Rarobacter incanus]TQK76891.1 peptide-methionine (R)-S-oxide reductase [Rarobacter incanus]